MATGRSFAEFVKDKCYNGLYQAAEVYVSKNCKSLDASFLLWTCLIIK